MPVEETVVTATTDQVSEVQDNTPSSSTASQTPSAMDELKAFRDGTPVEPPAPKAQETEKPKKKKQTEKKQTEKPKEFSDSIADTDAKSKVLKPGEKVEDKDKEDSEVAEKKAPKEAKKEKTEEAPEVEAQAEESVEAEDKEAEVDFDDQPVGEPDPRDTEIKEMRKLMEEMNSRIEDSSKTKKDREHDDQLVLDRALVENPFSYGFEQDSIQEFFGDNPEALEHFGFDPEGTKFQTDLVAKMLNQFMSKFDEYGVANQRVNEYNENQKHLERQNLLKNIEERGINLETFKTNGFKAFEESPEGKAFTEDFSKRFPDNDLEFAINMDAVYKTYQTNKRANTLASKQEEAQASRDTLSASQSQLDKAHISSQQSPPTIPVEDTSAKGLLEAYRNNKNK